MEWVVFCWFRKRVDREAPTGGVVGGCKGKLSVSTVKRYRWEALKNGDVLRETISMISGIRGQPQNNIQGVEKKKGASHVVTSLGYIRGWNQTWEVRTVGDKWHQNATWPHTF